MIGFYDYTVVLTYISLICSVFGMTQAIDGRFRVAIVCLALSGLLDMFDGKVARTKKDRTDDQKLFGVQIDSLCDVVCFGIFPAMICYILGVRGILGGIIIAYYGVCSVIRLAFFNVLETNRQREEDGANKYYHGLPITTMAIVLPLTFLLNFCISQFAFKCVLMVVLAVVGTLFIVDFKLKKPSNKMLAVLVFIVAAAVIVILLFSKYHIIRVPVFESPLLQKMME
ncbi:MAG: CDP-alcohol phosphatidyltransferase family protein [Lachnospiraceae bacterium]|nr:CDP-alcohol phosphatidyltransferase family protein [Lachnospiraceae bacterium]